jgi:hypothetical protein
MNAALMSVPETGPEAANPGGLKVTSKARLIVIV